jgi:anti-sigma B factor antagonist
MMWLSYLPDPSAHGPAGLPGARVVIEVHVAHGTAVLRVTGDLDLTSRPLLAERLSAALATGPRRLVLDLAGAGFMDAGSARVVASAGEFLPDGARLVIRRPNPVVRRVLALTGYDSGCEIVD